MPLDQRSGGSVWQQGTYDAELNLIYFGVAPTYDTLPLLHPIKDPSVNSDALYTDCTIALNPDTGKLVWFYQHLANDQWDLDWVFERQIVTMTIDGRPRKVVMNVGKMAILDALDAETGEYLFSVDSGTQNVITRIDPKTGAKTIDPEKWPDPNRPAVICPGRIRRQGLAADVLQPADRAALSAADGVVQPFRSGRIQAAHLGRGTERRGSSEQQQRHDGPPAGDRRQGAEVGVGAPPVGAAVHLAAGHRRWSGVLRRSRSGAQGV